MFAVEMVFFKIDESEIPSYRAFPAHFMSQKNDAILDRKLTLSEV